MDLVSGAEQSVNLEARTSDNSAQFTAAGQQCSCIWGRRGWQVKNYISQNAVNGAEGGAGAA